MLAIPVVATQASPVGTSASLLQQSGQMPAEFRDHLFNVPLAVRVEKDGLYLGDAQVVLGMDETVQLLSFEESHDSTVSPAERERWGQALSEPVALGTCSSACPAGLKALHYSLENSLLTVLTDAGGAAGVTNRFLSVPEEGSSGLVVRNMLNVNAGERQPLSASYAAELQGSIGHWSTLGSYTYNHASGANGESQHYMTALYAQRELAGHYVRAGYFLPNFDGVSRQPRAPGTESQTSFGVMAGSSDVLLASTAAPSLYPVYVTASRQGVVELRRDGALISTQAVQPGMQAIDTTRLPSGIYDIELRVIEDGQPTSVQQATIHKPNSWRDPSRRWRYSAFAGVQQGLLDSGNDDENGKPTAGALLNYLLHPRAVVGTAVRQVGNRRGVGASLDWQATDTLQLSTNLYDSTDAGRGINAQGMFVHGTGSLTAAHTRSWVEEREWLRPAAGGPPRWESYGGWQDSSSLALSKRLWGGSSITARVAYNSGFSAGTRVDVSLTRQQRIFGSAANWRVSAYDRPGTVFTGNRRQRGVDFTMSLALGEERRYNGSLGSRTGVGGAREVYAAAEVTQQLDNAWLRSVSANASVDRHGIGTGAGMQIDHPMLDGTANVQRSSGQAGWGGFLSLESNVAVGGGALAVVSRSQAQGDGTGMIVDVTSDLAGIRLRGDDNQGGGVVLRPGRNFIPVSAYRPGFVQFDFDGIAAPAATIQPATMAYHLNKGGVMHAKVNVLRTFTVMGQVLDGAGNGLRGVHVINHAGRSVSQDEGFFSLELSAREPVVELRYPDQSSCTLTLDEDRYPREADLVMVGGVGCDATFDVAQVRSPELP